MSNDPSLTRQPSRRPSNAYIDGSWVDFDFTASPSLPFRLNERVGVDPWLWSLPERNLTSPSSMIRDHLYLEAVSPVATYKDLFGLILTDLENKLWLNGHHPPAMARIHPVKTYTLSHPLSRGFVPAPILASSGVFQCYFSTLASTRLISKLPLSLLPDRRPRAPPSSCRCGQLLPPSSTDLHRCDHSSPPHWRPSHILHCDIPSSTARSNVNQPLHPSTAAVPHDSLSPSIAVALHRRRPPPPLDCPRRSIDLDGDVRSRG
ncbi:hypothetical protein E3N88_04713 [Mikania micrantha]|uniref:Uncharacterized protein n=1 Tax=Mikania micrantha TaxID=192012 RepID=A0A5N6PV91_9ASTR|nr:hypothetical protein E3N88_04713 [Mikania micrantha]